MKAPVGAIVVSAFAFCAGLAAPSAAPGPVSKRDAARLLAKIEKVERQQTDRRAHAPIRTAFSETELNAYLRYELADHLPRGVKDPEVTILGDGRLAGRATVDIGEVAKARQTSGGMLDPYSYLGGALPVTASGLLKAKNGVATFELESAAISGVAGAGLDAAGHRDALLAHTGGPPGRLDRSAVRTAGRYSRNPARPWAGDRHSVDRQQTGPGPVTAPALSPVTDFLQTPLQYLKGVGPRRAADLQRVGLATIEDLLYRFPIRYEDRGHLQSDLHAEGGTAGGHRRAHPGREASHHPARRIQDFRSDCGRPFGFDSGASG